MSAALREGLPVRLELSGAPPREIRLDELAPLCYAASARDPRDQRVLDSFRAPVARPGSDAQVTAIIPCNHGSPLGAPALFKQDVAVRLLVLSNGPDGPTRVPGAEILQVEWRGHGPTRQAALSQVRDPYVFFTVQDAIPMGAGFLRTMIEALEAGGWDAVVARQLAWPDADRVTRERLRRWTPAGHLVVPFNQTDNVATLYRTSALRRWPFPEVPIAEDAVWSRGRRVGYVPLAPVLHSHSRVAGELFRRNRDIHAELSLVGELPPVASLAGVLGALPGVIRPALIGGAGELQCQVGELLGQWRGAVRGKKMAKKGRKKDKRKADKR